MDQPLVKVHSESTLTRYDLNKDKREWNDDDREVIIDMFNAKSSITVIALHFGCSRNAIVGQISRLRKKGRVINGKQIIAANERYILRGHKTVASDKPYKFKSVAPHIAAEKAAPPKRIRLRLVSADKVKFADLKEWMCRYPEGDPRQSDFRFCGRQKQAASVTRTESSYCLEHQLLCTQEYRSKQPYRQPKGFSKLKF